jgi:hypothetical protein
MSGSSKIALSALVVAAFLAVPRPAQARFDIGIGTILGRTGISTGVDYRFGNWSDRFGAHIFMDASRYVNRRKKKDRRPVEEARRDGKDNIDLRVSPKESAVLLNGQLLELRGDDELELPAGHHRLEFVRPGYRTEVAELDVQSGVKYKVERKLQKLQKGEKDDARLQQPLRAVSVYEALRMTEAQWDVKRDEKAAVVTPATPEPERK